MDNRPQVSSFTEETDGLTIVWSDGRSTFFHSLWLRHQCYCEQCASPLDGLRDIWLENLSDNPEMLSSKINGDSLEIIWSDDSHQSRYPFAWLRENAYDDISLAERRFYPKLWNGAILDKAPRYDLERVLSDDKLKLDLLMSVRDLGFCLLRNVDTSIAGIEQAADIFGPIRQTHFGISEIIEKRDKTNVGDSGRALRPHMDETYRINGVGITILQMVNPSETGGESILTDGFYAARQLQSEDANAFDLLCGLNINFSRRHTGVSNDNRKRLLVSRAPIIKLDEWGELAGVRINERHVAPLDVPRGLTLDFYRALRKLFAIIYRNENQIQFPLAAGEALVFDNQRVLHGRIAFPRGETLRHARTCTVDTDEFQSTLRMMQIVAEDPEYNTYLSAGI